LAYDITGSSTYYAGGGGGGTNDYGNLDGLGGAGGNGGGGDGGDNDGNGANGTANTGGGGGGGGDNGGLGGDGGSGIVVVNYSYSSSSYAEHNLTISTGAGTVDMNGDVANIGTLSVTTTSSDSDISGVISTDTIVTKAGSGTLTLSGTNTYTGQTNINAGTLAVTVNDALGYQCGRYRDCLWCYLGFTKRKLQHH
jgi:autotransporter-associated beta strand protein